MAARMEAIKQLAGGIADRVVVMDRNFNVVYANESAWGERKPAGAAHPAKCYEAFAHRDDPCRTCPAVKVFDSPEVQSISCASHRDGSVCGMHQAFPLMGQDGDVASMLVLFRSTQGRALRMAAPSAHVGSPLPSERLGALIGRSPVMRELFEMVTLVAASQATVLIQGESGTGKELVAKTLHQLSGRRDKPFVVVDCGSLPETLLESELFGHVKGAFTGATSHKRGLFEEAHGGTLFLDEIADTSPAFQAKLLRVLQEGEIKRVGQNRRITIDVRVISASNKDLSALVDAKMFRQDLYYRLAVLPIHVPSLRQRKEDIPLLVHHFVAASCARHHQPLRQVSEKTMHVFTEAAWPGNVRELQHAIERAIVTTSGPSLHSEEKASQAAGTESVRGDLRSVSRSAAKTAERTRIVQALREVSGNRARAAKLLRISRAGLYVKLREYAIQETE
jgi:two-component system, NtrC family, response regulator HydG